MRDVTDLYQEFGDERVPPGQGLRDDFPILSKGTVPRIDTDDWAFTVSGAVESERTFSWEEFLDLPSETQRQDFHCVTGWSRLDTEFTGVPFPEIAERAGVHDDVVHVMFGAADDYTTDLSFESCNRREVLFAYELDGEPLPADHGGPLRVVTPHRYAYKRRGLEHLRPLDGVVTPHRYAYKGAKWVTSVTFLTEKERGFWEKRGYSDTANPWNEERYS